MNQKADILNHLKKYDEISPIEALNQYRCFRLAARIHELRKEGYAICEERADGGYAVYRLKVEGQGVLFNV